MSDVSNKLRNRIRLQRKVNVVRLPLRLAYEAEDILNQKNTKSEEAVFLLLCAANFLNTFVKQSEDNHFKDNYSFKQTLMEGLKQASPDFVSLAREKDVFIASCKGFQFSFHHVPLHLLNRNLVETKWAQIRLQPYALDLFKEALDMMNPEGEMIAQFKALADPMRLKILEILLKGERCACTFTEELPISQSTLSHHLSVLFESKLIDMKKEGVKSLVSINNNAFKDLEKSLKQYYS